MDQRVSIITLGVKDLAKAKGFYEALGWKAAEMPPEEEGNIVAFDLQTMTLALYPLDKLDEDTGQAIERKGPPTFTLAYNVASEKEVDQTLTDAQTCGANIIKPAEKAFWGGYSGYFTDLDGYYWEVAFNPFAKLGPKGEFQWNGVEISSDN
ncbi:MAG: VOC family protein [Lentilitoribacter sp.]